MRCAYSALFDSGRIARDNIFSRIAAPSRRHFLHLEECFNYVKGSIRSMRRAFKVGKQDVNQWKSRISLCNMRIMSRLRLRNLRCKKNP